MSTSTAADVACEPQTLGFHLSFFKLNVRDIDRMARFYAETFGMQETQRIDQPLFREIMLQCPGDRFTLVLFQYLDGRQIEIGSGYGPVGFMTKDIEKAIARAVAQGAVNPRGPIDLPRMRAAFLTDPEGHEIELLQTLR